MGERGKRQDGFYVDRLDFLRYSLATTVAVWAGAGVAAGPGLSKAEAQEIFGTRQLNPKLFPQSVASGDPAPNGIVLWTRVRPPADGRTLRVGYRVALDDDRGDGAAFADPVLSGVVETGAGRDYTVKVQLKRAELRPGRRYRYRFYAGESFSRTGRFKTLPAPDAEVPRARFGYISCQDYTNGYFNALYHLEKENIDFVVHLGDYTYETVASDSFQGGGPEERQFRFPDGGDEELTLRDYRFTYGKYKADQNLQRLHEKCAFIMIWDDHEYANDAHQLSAPDSGGTTAGNKKDPRRREAANRAWAEYNPVGVYYNPATDPLNEIVLYRSFPFGDLMELVMTDQRLYRDGPPNGNSIEDRYVTPGTGREGEEAPGRTMLGDGTRGENGLPRPPQINYFLNKVTRSPKVWKMWGNEVTFMQIKVANTSLGPETVLSLEELFPGIGGFPAGAALGNSPEGVYVTLDQWDGYQVERRRITRAVRDSEVFPGRPGIENFVTLTGDIHSYIAGYIKENFDDPGCTGDNRPVGVELVCPSVTSSNLAEIATFGFGAAPAPDVGQFTATVTVNNPHIKFFNSSEHGYNVMDVTRDSIVCTMKAIRTNPSPANPNANGIRERDPVKTRSETLRRFRVPAFGTTFAGQRVTGPLLIDETSGVPVPLPC